MINNAVADRYAKTLFLSIKDSSIFKIVENDMNSIEEVLTDYPQLDYLLKDITIKSEDKKQSILKAFSNLSSTTIHFIQFIHSKKRIYLLKEISEEFIKLICEKENIKQGTIISSVELTKEQIEQIAKKLSSKNNKKFVFDCVVDKDLIGGFLIKIDDKIIDWSIKNKLKKLKENLSTSKI